MERLHYHVSTNLGLLQANLTYMHAKLGTSYNWIPDLYQRMHLPVFEGVVEALEKHSVRRKRKLDMAKTTPAKKRRVLSKRNRVLEGHERKKWSGEHGHDTYGGSHHESRSDCGEGKPMTSKSVRVGQPHTNERVTETVLSTSVVFCVPKRRAIQRVLRMCTGSPPTPTSRSAMLTCTISVVRMVPHQTAALVMKVWLCARVELKGEPTRETVP